MTRALSILILLLALTHPAAAETRLTTDLRNQLAALPTLGKHTYSGAGGRVTLVTFFASWCPPCRDEFHVLNRIRDEISEDKLAIVAINYFESFSGLSNPVKLKRFLKQLAPKFPAIKGNDEIAQIFEKVTRIPTVFIFDRAGVKRLHFIHHEGATKMSLTYDELKTALDKLL